MTPNRDAHNSVADRHSHTLGGKFYSLERTCSAQVTIIVSAAAAKSRCGQLVATWLANLMGRMAGVVERVGVILEGGDQPLQHRVDPRGVSSGDSFADSVLRNARLSNPALQSSPIDPEGRNLRVGVGHPTAACDVYASATPWIAYVGSSLGPECEVNDSGPVGPVVAAALASGEVFKILRAKEARSQTVRRCYFDTFAWRFCDGFSQHNELTSRPGMLRSNFVLAGVGAVGTAFLLTLWSMDIGVSAVIVDGDKVADSNLNRYPLFSFADLKLPKADRARDLLNTDTFSVQAHSLWWSEYQKIARESPSLLLSAVDTNVARHQLQDALPRLIIGASTHDLRAEVGRYDLADARSRCLKCFNAPEAAEDDAKLQRRLLGMERSELERYAESCGASVARLVDYVDELRAGGSGCALLAGEALDSLRVCTGERQFAVSFVSAFAGAMLCAQVVREAAGIPMLVPPTTRAVFQFWRPAAASNRVADAPVDSNCSCSTHIVRDTFSSLWR